MKKTLAILLLMTLFFSQIGYQLIYMIQQHEAKEAAERALLSNLPDSSLEQIDLEANKNDIEWEEEGKEFFLHGEMYDVARTKNLNGRTIIYCLNDKKEAQVLEDLAKAVDASDDQNTNNNHKHGIKFQLTDLIVFTDSSIFIDQPASVKHIDFDMPILFSFNEIVTPPPNSKFYA